MAKKKLIIGVTSSENIVKSASPVNKRIRRSRMSQEEIDCAMADALRVLESLRKIASGDYTEEMRRQYELGDTVKKEKRCLPKLENTVKTTPKRFIRSKRYNTWKRMKGCVKMMCEKKKREEKKQEKLLLR